MEPADIYESPAVRQALWEALEGNRSRCLIFLRRKECDAVMFVVLHALSSADAAQKRLLPLLPKPTVHESQLSILKQSHAD